MLTLADQRQDECATQLWCVGCSITHGVGVNANERSGMLIADYLKLPVSFLLLKIRFCKFPAPPSMLETQADNL